MRLLERNSSDYGFVLTKDLARDDIPPYAILSHTWVDGQEVTFNDLNTKTGKRKTGYAKLEFCSGQAERDGLQYFWVDTCCINKADNTELQFAINSMFRWYQNATKCYVYLSDVSAIEDESSDGASKFAWESAFRASRWFTRGWTLQELLAPSCVEFFSQEQKKLGDKQVLKQQLQKITGIPILALQGSPLSHFSVNERLSWKNNRQTKIEEDGAYSLLGIFSVYIAPLYGEGISEAFKRLLDEITKQEKCIQDLRLTDPRDDKKRIEETKGGLLEDSYRWVLNNPDFQQWHGDEQGQVLWIKGDPGKGKTMLLCGIINELNKSMITTKVLSYFFCQAADSRINNATAVLRGLLYMLVSQQPSLVSHVRKKYDQAGKALFEDANAWVALSEIFENILQDPNLSTKYLIIDALDECVSDLPKLLDFVVQHSSTSGRVKWIVSSRNWPIIEEYLAGVGDRVKLSLELNGESVSAAVELFIQYKVLQLVQKRKYDDRTQRAVQSYLTLNANGTFLWVALVCKNLESIPRWRAIAALNAFPPGLDSLYRQMMDQMANSGDADLCTQILATIAIVYRPIMVTELTSLVEMLEDMADDLESVYEILGLCGSFITVREGVVYFVHQSAKDFLLDKVPNKIFPSGSKEAHYNVFSKSLQVLSKTLRRDMYNLRIAGYPIAQVEQPDPDPLGLSRYSCVYWVDHLSASPWDYKRILVDGGEVHHFLQKHFLHWLEAMSLLKKIPDAIAAMQHLQSVLTKTKSTMLSQTVHDLMRFIMWSGAIIQEAPLQVYYSALLLSPERSIVRKQFNQEMPDWINVRSGVDEDWGPQLQTLEGHADLVNSVTFSPKGDRLASASEDRTVRLWDANTGQQLLILMGHTESVSSVAFSPQGDRIASVSGDRTIKLWDVLTGQPLLTLEGHTEWLTSVTFSPQGDQLASTSGDWTIRLWDANRGELLLTLCGHTGWVTSVAFSPQGDRIASASGDRTVRLWDANTGSPLLTLEGHTAWLTSVAFSPQGDRIASASGDRTVRLWDVNTGQLLLKLQSGSAWLTSVTFSPQGDRIASASGNRKIRLWDANTGKPMQTLDTHTGLVKSVAFSPRGDRLASASADRTIRLWDVGAGQLLQTLDGHAGYVTSVSLSPQGDRLASASHDRTVRIWDVETGHPLRTLEGHTEWVMSVTFSPQGDRLASASDDRTVRLWDATTGQPLLTFEGHTGWVRSVAFSLRGDRIASASGDRTVRIWDVNTGQSLQTLGTHQNMVTSVVFSPQGDRLASILRDRTIRIWDVDKGQPIQTLGTYKSMVANVVFSSQGDRLASTLADQTTQLWDVNTAQLLQPTESDKSWVPSTFQVVSTQDQWVLYKMEAILLLPLPYRNSCSTAHGSTIALGTVSGRILVLSFSK